MAKAARTEKAQQPKVEYRFTPSWAVVLIAVILALLVLLQGGFYGVPAIAAGVIAAVGCVVLVVQDSFELRVVPAALLCVVALGGLVSALLAGVTSAMVIEIARWVALAAVALFACSFDEDASEDIVDAICWVGVGIAALSLIGFVGEGVTEGFSRMWGFFQYANASGIFFAVAALLCLNSQKFELQLAAAVPAVALLATMSVGACGLFAVGLLALAILHFVESRYEHRALCLVVPIVVVAAVAIAVVVLFPDRLAESQGTFAERIAMMQDAATLLAANPMGIGPDMWKDAYPAIQTTDYIAMKVHCSYLQIALDCGAVGLLAFVAFVIFGLVRLIRREQYALTIAVVILAAHAIFDFDFCFAALLVLIVMLEECATCPKIYDLKHCALLS